MVLSRSPVKKPSQRPDSSNSTDGCSIVNVVPVTTVAFVPASVTPTGVRTSFSCSGNPAGAPVTSRHRRIASGGLEGALSTLPPPVSFSVDFPPSVGISWSSRPTKTVPSVVSSASATSDVFFQHSSFPNAHGLSDSQPTGADQSTRRSTFSTGTVCTGTDSTSASLSRSHSDSETLLRTLCRKNVSQVQGSNFSSSAASNVAKSVGCPMLCGAVACGQQRGSNVCGDSLGAVAHESEQRMQNLEARFVESQARCSSLVALNKKLELDTMLLRSEHQDSLLELTTQKNAELLQCEQKHFSFKMKWVEEKRALEQKITTCESEKGVLAERVCELESQKAAFSQQQSQMCDQVRREVDQKWAEIRAQDQQEFEVEIQRLKSEREEAESQLLAEIQDLKTRTVAFKEQLAEFTKLQSLGSQVSKSTLNPLAPAFQPSDALSSLLQLLANVNVDMLRDKGVGADVASTVSDQCSRQNAAEVEARATRTVNFQGHIDSVSGRAEFEQELNNSRSYAKSSSREPSSRKKDRVRSDSGSGREEIQDSPLSFRRSRTFTEDRGSKLLRTLEPKKFGKTCKAGEFDEFRAVFEEYMAANGVPPNNNFAFLRILAKYLEGAPLLALRRMTKQEPDISYKTVMEKLEYCYSKKPDKIVASRGLRDITKRKNETWQEFAERIQNLVEESKSYLTPEAKEDHAGDWFYQALPEEWLDEVTKKVGESNLISDYLAAVMEIEQRQERCQRSQGRFGQQQRGQDQVSRGQGSSQRGQYFQPKGYSGFRQRQKYPDQISDKAAPSKQQPKQPEQATVQLQRRDSETVSGEGQQQWFRPRAGSAPTARSQSRRGGNQGSRGPPRKTSVGDPRYQTTKCFKCLELGHLSRDCPQNTDNAVKHLVENQQPTTDRPQQVAVTSQGSASVTQSVFGNLGMLLGPEGINAVTPNAADVLGRSIRHPVKIEGVDVIAVLDTGAVASIMPHAFVERLAEFKPIEFFKENVRKCQGNLRAYDGTLLKNIRQYLLVNVEVDGVTRQVPIMVDMSRVSTLGSEVLLGIPALEALGFEFQAPGGQSLFAEQQDAESPEMEPKVEQVPEARIQSEFDFSSQDKQFKYIRRVAVLTEKLIPSQSVKSVLTDVLLPNPSELARAQKFLFLPDTRLEDLEMSIDPCIVSLDEKGEVKLPVRNLFSWPVHCEAKQDLGSLTVVGEEGDWEEVDISEFSIKRVIEPFELRNDRRTKLVELLKSDQWCVDEDQKQTVLGELLAQHEMFAIEEKELGQAEGPKMEIDTGKHAPIKERCRRVPFAIMEELGEKVKQLLAAGVIEKSSSPWASPIVIVRKKGTGEMRVCVDYSKVNDATKKDAYPIPHCASLLDAAGAVGAKYFTTLDLRSGYYQILMDPEAKEKTAFICPYGLFEYNCMPFGLTNAPAMFQRMMDTVFAGIETMFGPGKVNVYLDDILIVTSTFEEHIQILMEVFRRLRKYGLKLHPKKCCFFRKSVEFLGYVMSRDGLTTDPTKVAAVREFPVPKTITNLKSFLGLCSYYRRFVKNFSQIAKPMNDLLKGNPKRLNWNDEAQQAFDLLKVALTSAPVLKFPDMSKPFVIETDGSGLGLGAVLEQYDDEKKGLRPIAFISRSLKGAEVRYWSTDLEMMCVKYALKTFRTFIYGKEVTVYTDNQNTIDLVRKKEDLASNRQQRWKMFIQSTKAKLLHKKGKDNKVADSLSRNPIDLSPEERKAVRDIQAIFVVQQQELDECQGQVEGYAADWMVQVKKEQANDKVCRSVYNFKVHGLLPPDEQQVKWLVAMDSRFHVIGGVVFYVDPVSKNNWSYRVYVPVNQRDQLIWEMHVSPSGGHLGKRKLIQKLQSRYYWPKMFSNIEHYLKECKVCASRQGQGRLLVPPLKPLDTPIHPFQMVGMDILKLPLTLNGNRYALVVTDLLSRYVLACAMPDQKAETTINAWAHMQLPFGPPEKVLTDQGVQFVSELMAKMCELLQIERITTTTFHPQANGATEKQNRHLCDMLAKVTDKQGSNWDEMLKFVVFAYNSSENVQTRRTPFELVFGRKPNFPSGSVMAYPTLYYNVDPDTFKDAFPQMMKDAWAIAKECSDLAKAKQKEQYDKLINKNPAFQVGDFVMVKDLAQKTHKLSSPFVGPAEIITLDDTDAEVQFNHRGKTKIKKFHLSKLSRATPELVQKHYGQGKNAVLEPQIPRRKDEGWDGIEWSEIVGNEMSDQNQNATFSESQGVLKDSVQETVKNAKEVPPHTKKANNKNARSNARYSLRSSVRPKEKLNLHICRISVADNNQFFGGIGQGLPVQPYGRQLTAQELVEFQDLALARRIQQEEFDRAERQRAMADDPSVPGPSGVQAGVRLVQPLGAPEGSQDTSNIPKSFLASTEEMAAQLQLPDYKTLTPEEKQTELVKYGIEVLSKWHYGLEGMFELTPNFRPIPDELKRKRVPLKQDYEFQTQEWFQKMPERVQAQTKLTPNITGELAFESSGGGLGKKQHLHQMQHVTITAIHSGYHPCLQPQYVIVDEEYSCDQALHELQMCPQDESGLRNYGYDSEHFQTFMPDSVKRDIRASEKHTETMAVWEAQKDKLWKQYRDDLDQWKAEGRRHKKPREPQPPKPPSPGTIQLSERDLAHWVEHGERADFPFSFSDQDERVKKVYGIRPFVDTKGVSGPYQALLQITSFHTYCTYIFVLRNLLVAGGETEDLRHPEEDRPVSRLYPKLVKFLKDSHHRFWVVNMDAESRALFNTWGISTTKKMFQAGLVLLVGADDLALAFKLRREPQKPGIKKMMQWAIFGGATVDEAPARFIEEFKRPTVYNPERSFPNFAKLAACRGFDTNLWDYVARDSEWTVFIVSALLMCHSEPMTIAADAIFGVATLREKQEMDRGRGYDCQFLHSLRNSFFQFNEKPAAATSITHFSTEARVLYGTMAAEAKRVAEALHLTKFSLTDWERHWFMTWPNGFEFLFQALAQFGGSLRAQNIGSPSLRRALMVEFLHHFGVRWRLDHEPKPGSGTEGALIDPTPAQRQFYTVFQFNQRISRGYAGEEIGSERGPQGIILSAARQVSKAFDPTIVRAPPPAVSSRRRDSEERAARDAQQLRRGRSLSPPRRVVMMPPSQQNTGWGGRDKEGFRRPRVPPPRTQSRARQFSSRAGVSGQSPMRRPDSRDTRGSTPKRPRPSTGGSPAPQRKSSKAASSSSRGRTTTQKGQGKPHDKDHDKEAAHSPKGGFKKSKPPGFRRGGGM